MILYSLDCPVALGKFSNLTHEWGAEILYENPVLANKLFTHGQMIDHIINNQDTITAFETFKQASNAQYSTPELNELYELAHQYVLSLQAQIH